MFESAILLLFSLLVLGKAAQIVIDSSLTLAKYLRISEIAVGFIILSTATSLPELVVSVLAAFQNEPGISMGTLLGANIADICIVLGIPLLLSKSKLLPENRSSLEKILIVTIALPLLIITLPRALLGLVLLVIYAIYTYYMLQAEVSLDGFEKVSRNEAAKSTVLFFVGILLVVGSSKYAVDSSVIIANSLGISKILIASTTISLGTTLPELAVSISALRSRRIGLAVGNALGSCITNLTLILGLATMIAPFYVSRRALLTVIFFHSLACFVFLIFLRKRKTLGRAEGIALLSLYAIYVPSVIILETVVNSL
jgi:cation:H+ antiporter